MEMMNKKLYILILFTLPMALSKAEDVIKTTAGEVLIGEFISETDDSIVFDSNAFGKITVAKSKVISTSLDGIIQTSKDTNVSTVSSKNQSTKESINDDNQEENKSFLQKSLNLPKNLTVTVSGGLNIVDNVTDTETHSADLTLAYTTHNSVFESHSSYAYGTTSVPNGNQFVSHKIQDKYSSQLEWTYTYNEIFKILSHLGWEKDGVKGIDGQSTFAVFPLYTIHFNKNSSLVLGAGLAGQHSSLTLQNNFKKEYSGVAVGFYNLFSWQFTPLLTFKQSFIGYQHLNNKDNQSFNFMMDLSQALTSHMFVALNYKKDYDRDEFSHGTVENTELMSLQLRYQF